MNKRGQSIIEYVLIAILVILGIVFMGPYVLRSVNGHFKMWDEGVQDSFTENITQAPPGDMPFINSTCVCSDSPTGACGTSSATSQCTADEEIYAHTCNPVGCDGAPSSSCKSDPTLCCQQYFVQGCGTIPIPSTGIPVNTIPATGGLPSGCSSYANTNNNCYYDQRLWATECSVASTACCPDPNCAPKCLGLNSPGVIACPNATTGLTQDLNLTYVAGASSCTGSPLCQVYCDNTNGYTLNASGTACINEFQVALSVSNCTNGCPATSYSLGCTHSGYVTTNDCSFQMCASAGAIITGVNLTDVSSPETSPYCNNPGNPGEMCEVAFTYH